MKQNRFPLEIQIAERLEEAKEDYIGLWQISRSTSDFFGVGEQAREEALAVIRLLLANGLLAGNLTSDGGCVAWPDQDPNSVIARIRREWIALGKDPTINDIAWFWVLD